MERDIIQIIVWVVLGFPVSWFFFYAHARRRTAKFHTRVVNVAQQDSQDGVLMFLMGCAIFSTGVWTSAVTFNVLQLIGAIS